MARILIGNIKGPKGDTGPQGEQGPVGPQGPQGPLPPLVNNALSTEAGVAALDAVMGKTLQDQITQVNSDLNSRTAVSDLNTAVDVSPHAPLIVQCDANTLNTPYKAGLTSSASGTAYITGGSDSNYLTMFYVPASDPNMFIRSRASGTWYDWGHIITNADIAAIAYNDTAANSVEDLLKAKGKIAAQNVGSNICGVIPGGWQGSQFGFTIFTKAYNTIILMFIGNYDVYMASYDSSADSLSGLKRLTATDV